MDQGYAICGLSTALVLEMVSLHFSYESARPVLLGLHFWYPTPIFLPNSLGSPFQASLKAAPKSGADWAHRPQGFQGNNRKEPDSGQGKRQQVALWRLWAFAVCSLTGFFQQETSRTKTPQLVSVTAFGVLWFALSPILLFACSGGEDNNLPIIMGDHNDWLPPKQKTSRGSMNRHGRHYIPSYHSERLQQPFDQLPRFHEPLWDVGVLILILRAGFTLGNPHRRSRLGA